MSSRSNKLRNLGLSVILFTALLLVAERGARGYLNANTPPSINGFRLSRPAAYAQSPYWSQAFTEEQISVGPAWHLDDQGQWTIDFHGQWHNAEAGIRRTAYQPAGATNTVYMFGSSNLFASEVPDESTIPSQLQLLFNRFYANRYKVINLGRDAVTARQEYQRLLTLKLIPGDIVIFYDGRNEVYDNYPELSARRDTLLSGKVCNWLITPFVDVALVGFYCLLVDESLPPIMTKASQWQEWSSRLADEYQSALTDAYHYSTRSGAQFYHFLQPTIWSKALSAYEQTVVNNYNLVPRGLDEAMRYGWPAVQAVQRRLVGSGIDSFDFTHVLDAIRSSGAELYLDDAHVTERGDLIVAQAMFDTMSAF